MKHIPFVMAFIFCLVLVAGQASAMTSDTLDITIGNDGRADIVFTYRLNWIEYISVYLRLVDPARELGRALESNFHKPVRVVGVDSGNVHLVVDSFAQVSERDGMTTIRTPALSFVEGERILRGYWFAPLVSVDLSPALTSIRFPDGSVATFHDALEIPSQVRTW